MTPSRYGSEYELHRDVALSLRASWPALSYRQIAAGLQIHHPTVSRIHEQMRSGGFDTEDFMTSHPEWPRCP